MRNPTSKVCIDVAAEPIRSPRTEIALKVITVNRAEKALLKAPAMGPEIIENISVG